MKSVLTTVFNQIVMRRILAIIFIIIGGSAIWLIQFNLDMSRHKTLSARLIEELMYFPSGKFLKPSVIEYRSAMSDLVWLRAIQYYGQHMMTDRKYEWLSHIFDILTTLDSKFIGAYHFGSMILAWDAHQSADALKLLSMGHANNPLNWQLVFDAAFINYMIRRDYTTAGYYFEIASNLPNTWRITKRWAAFSYAKGGATEMAIEIWLAIYNTTENRRLKELAERELNRLGLKP